jgi:hypothetical protein
MRKFRERLPIVLSVTALVVALGAGTPAIALTIVDYARNADKVDNIHASKKPAAGKLLPLNSAKRLPAGLATLESLEGTRCTWGSKTGAVHLQKPLFAEGSNNGVYTLNSVLCLVPDRYEENDTQIDKRQLLNAGTGSDRRESMTLYPSGDDDWYSSNGNLQYLCVFLGEPAATVHAWRGPSELVPTVSDNGYTLMFNAGAATGMWQIHLDGSPRTYTVSLTSSAFCQP